MLNEQQIAVRQISGARKPSPGFEVRLRCLRIRYVVWLMYVIEKAKLIHFTPLDDLRIASKGLYRRPPRRTRVLSAGKCERACIDFRRALRTRGSARVFYSRVAC